MAAPARGIALLSGGLDSGVAAATFARQPGRVLAACLFVAYGQRAARPEAEAASRLARRLAAPLLTIELPWLGDLARSSGSRLIRGTGDLPHGTERVPGDAASAAAVWVPARNVVFVAIAAAHAEAMGARFVVTGFNREEAATFADNSAAFVAASDTMLALGTRTGVQVTSPTLALDKAEIVASARALGFTAADFWSCYEGGAAPCGRCESCLRSRWTR
ncbi:MAG: 7-cyano-7-deazaguanine synthase QueC [Planctomycetes bacterium]|nr:7-cyano-7-deazaguanine synthase QueC [Planctomycetota bacterium]